MKRQIDILIATYNGERTLPAMLGALERLVPPERPWRVIVIDNGSTDSTPELLQEAAQRLPLEVHRCPQAGKVTAQQFGRQFLEGDLVVLTDDDILPDPGWLAELEAGAEAWPDACIFGGGIVPTPIEDVGGWYAASETYHGDLFALTKAGAGRVTGADSIFGPNMMLRRDAAERALSQPSVLGPTARVVRGKRVFALGDESEMIASLEREGCQAVFLPQAQVKHLVRGFQTELDFMLQRAQNHGRGVAVRHVQNRTRRGVRARTAADSALRAVWLWPRVMLSSRSTPSRRAFDRLYGLNWHLGRAKGAMTGPFPD